MKACAHTFCVEGAEDQHVPIAFALALHCDVYTDVGFDSKLGARPLKRAIATHLLNPLASLLLSHAATEGSHVEVSVAPAVPVGNEQHSAAFGTEGLSTRLAFTVQDPSELRTEGMDASSRTAGDAAITPWGE